MSSRREVAEKDLQFIESFSSGRNKDFSTILHAKSSRFRSSARLLLMLDIVAKAPNIHMKISYQTFSSYFPILFVNMNQWDH